MFYYQTDFDFSVQAKNWIIKLLEDKWKNNFDHDAEYDTLKRMGQISPIARELRPFLKKHGLDDSYAGINIFISNTRKKVKTNPHIDILNKNNQYLPIFSRFNVMILGNPEDPMYWWQNFYWGHKDLIENTYSYFEKKIRSLGVPGDSIEKRLEYLGLPSETKSELLAPSAFVNTEYAHALEISSMPRLIVSVAFNKKIEEYV